MEQEKPKSNWGGRRPNQTGRPKKDEELMVINLLDKYIDRDVVVIELFKKIKEGDMKAITLYLNYVYGKPLQTINQNTTLNVNDIELKDLIDFKPTKDSE